MRPEKKVMVEVLSKKLFSASSFILADYRGLKVEEMNELRKALLEEATELMVIPNRMFKLALKNTGIGNMEEYIEGPTAVVFGGRDAVTIAKILYNFSREHKELKLKGGFLDNVALSGDKVEEVAKLPSRNELLSRFVGQLSAPLSGFLLVLSGPARGFVSILGKLEEARKE